MTDRTPGSEELLLPEGTRLLHFGPPETGTAALQAALFAARPDMLVQGVRHVGKTRDPAGAARAVTGPASAASTERPPSILEWNDLVRAVRRARELRLIVSSGRFAWATPDVVGRIARDLDVDRLHVAVTLRPLGQVLPSQWQQEVQAGTVLAYETWLRQVLGPRAGKAAAPFWAIQRHDELIARWAAGVGGDRVTVVVADELDPDGVLRGFEGLLGLRVGTLEPVADVADRSLTLPEVEAVRAFNLAAAGAGLPRGIQARVMRHGAAIYMKTRLPGPDEPRIETPQWALDRAGEIAAEIVAGIAASGVRVVGDLGSLAAVPRSRLEGDRLPEVSVPPAIAASMAMGVVVASGLATGGPSWLDAGPEPPEVALLSAWQVGIVLVRRTTADGARLAVRGLRRTRAQVARLAVGGLRRAGVTGGAR